MTKIIAEIRAAALVVVVLCVTSCTARTNDVQGSTVASSVLVGVPLSPFQGMTDPSQAFDLMQSAGTNLVEVRKLWSQLEDPSGVVSFDMEPFPFTLLDKERRNYPSLVKGVVVNLEIVDTTRRTMPADLATNSFDDPAVLARFDKVIDKLAAQRKDRPIQYVVLGHEIDVYLVRHPNEVEAFETLYRHSLDRIHNEMPGVQVGTSLTNDGVKNHGALADRMSSYGDVVVYTYYPLMEDSQMRPVSQVSDDLKLLADRAHGKKFAFLEVGYSASSANSGTDQAQAQFVDAVFHSLDPYRTSGQLEFMQYWMMFDFPPDLAQQAAQAYNIPGTGPSFVAFLSTLGLRHYDQGGAKRPGWDVFSSMASAWSKGRALP
jgi:hypothetical protein